MRERIAEILRRDAEILKETWRERAHSTSSGLTADLDPNTLSEVGDRVLSIYLSLLTPGRSPSIEGLGSTLRPFCRDDGMLLLNASRALLIAHDALLEDLETRLGAESEDFREAKGTLYRALELALGRVLLSGGTSADQLLGCERLDENALLIIDREFQVLRCEGPGRSLVEGRRCYAALAGRSEPCIGCPAKDAMDVGIPRQLKLDAEGEGSPGLIVLPVDVREGMVQRVAIHRGHVPSVPTEAPGRVEASRVERSRALAAADRAVSREVELRSALEGTGEDLLRAYGMEVMVLFSLDPGRDRLELEFVLGTSTSKARSTEGRLKGLTLDLENLGPSLRETFETGSPLGVSDLSALSRENPSASLLLEALEDAFSVKSLNVFAARAFDRTLGLVFFAGEEALEGDVGRDLDGLSCRIGLGLASRSLRVESETHVLRARTLATATRGLIGEKDIEALSARIVEGFTVVLDVPAAALLLVDDWGERLEVRASTGLSQRFVESERVRRRDVPFPGRSTELLPFVVRRIRPAEEREIEMFEMEPIVSALSLPIWVRGEFRGVLNAYSRGKPREFSEEEIEMAKVFAGSVSFALESFEMKQESEGRRSGANTLFEMRRLMTATDSLDEILGHVVEQGGKALDVRTCRLFLLDSLGRELIGRVSTGVDSRDIRGTRIPLDLSGPIRQAAESLKPVETRSRAQGFPGEEGEETPILETSLVVPIVTRNRLRGMLVLERRAGAGPFSERELEFALNLAHQLGFTMESQEALAAERRRSTDLHAVSRIGGRVVSILDLPELCRRTLEEIRASFGFRFMSLFLLVESRLDLRETLGFEVEGEEPYQMDLKGPGLVPLAARSAESVISGDVREDGRWIRGSGPLEGVSEMAVPVRDDEGVIGVLDVQSEELHAFDERDAFLMESLSAQVAIAVRNAKIYQESQRRAMRDPGTDLYNRRHLFSILDREMAKVDRYGRVLSVIMADIDGFKGYNDSFGHLAGDRLLRDLGRIFLDEVRQTDVVGRYGGEEFLFILPETEKDNALNLAERVRVRVQDHDFGGTEGSPDSHVTLSLGVASYPADATSRERLIDAADQALYGAKRKGKNCVHVHRLDAERTESGP
jgi:diguanylate cyclase (GGDEF)-like protein